MKKNKGKGFTIVELVIVIAVIAILAAVLIPTFASLIEKANLSSDIQAVRQMNMVLAAESAVTKPDEFKDVCDILREAGYAVDEGLFPVSKNHNFLWHKDQNEIFLAKIVDDESIAKVVFPEDSDVITFTDYANYQSLLGVTVFDLAYPDYGYARVEGAVTGVTLSDPELELVVGETATLTATVTPNDATNKEVTWSSSAESVATVEGGVVTAVSDGTATITVTTVDGGKTATCKVTVSAKDDDSTGGGSTGGGSGTTPDEPATIQVSISPATLTIPYGDNSKQTVTVTVTPASSSYTVKLDSSDKSVATVSNSSGKSTDEDGKATFNVNINKKGVLGDTTITVTVNDTEYKDVTCTVTVKDALSDVDQLVKDLQDGGTITLISNKTYEEELGAPIVVTKDTTLNLNGATFILNSDGTSNSALDVRENATLTINGPGTLFVTGADNHPGIYVNQGCRLNMNQVTVQHPDKACLTNKGKTSIKGCTFNSPNAYWADTINNGYDYFTETAGAYLHISDTTITAKPDLDKLMEWLDSSTAAQNAYNGGVPGNAYPVITNAAGCFIDFGSNVTIDGYLLNKGNGGVYANNGTETGEEPKVTEKYAE